MDHHGEAKRLNILKAYQILDTIDEDAYDEIAQLASIICKTPVSLISFVDDHRQWFKSRVGLDVQETPVEQAFCAHAIKDPENIFEVEDAKTDDRFVDNPLVTDSPKIRFYAGAPLITSEGVALGTLCVIDQQPRSLSKEQRNALLMLSKQVMRLLEARRISRQYESLFDATSDLIYELDSEGKYRYVNKKVVNLLEYNAEELQDIICWDMVPEAYRQEAIAYHLKEIKHQKKSIYSELPIRSKEGKLIWLRQTVDYTYDHNGTVIQTYVIAKDISDIKSSMEEQDNLVAVIAHDLKSPLNQIYGLSDLLKGELTGESAIFNEMIQKVSVDGRKMIDNLVYLKAYEKNGFTPIITDLDLRQFYQTKLQGFAELAKKKQISMDGTCSTLDTLTKMDEGALSRIVDNLISNAIKFSPKGTHVFFNLTQDDSFLQLEIKDEGPGFTADDKKNLFQKFQKLSARPTGGERSTGLGLSIVNTLITGLGGQIDLISEPGKGSTFRVRFTSQELLNRNDAKS